jgi:hypothetical protein
MHESEAMNFIEPVLLGFLSRNFDGDEGENPLRYEPHLKRIKEFIQDNEPYWVKEKSLFIIDAIEGAETGINRGDYVLTSPENFVTAVLERVKKLLTDTGDHFKDNRQKDRMYILLPLPSFPEN